VHIPTLKNDASNSFQSSILFNKNRNAKRRAKARRGAMLVFICVLTIVFLFAVAMSVDVAYMHLVNSELRAASDSAAKAAAQQLSDEVRSRAASGGSISQSNVINRAKTVAQTNLVAGRGLQLSTSDIEIGRSVRSGAGRYQFTPGATPENSVRVTGRRTNGSISGNVGLFFGRVFGTSSYQPQQQAIGTFVQRNIVLVIDRSGSMKFNEEGDRIYGDTFGPDSKITKLKQSLDSFMVFLNSSKTTEKIGVVSFSNDATMDRSLTTSINAVRNAYVGLVPDGRTAIALGIDAGVSLMNQDLQSQFVERTLVVLTDGQENIGRDGVDYGDGGDNLVPLSQSAVTAAQDAAIQGFQVFSITYCVDSPKGRDTMQEVARIGGGKYYDATGQASLNEAFKDIAFTLNAMLTN
jgi:Ca-activated chloride channel homolog